MGMGPRWPRGLDGLDEAKSSINFYVIFLVHQSTILTSATAGMQHQVPIFLLFLAEQFLVKSSFCGRIEESA